MTFAVFLPPVALGGGARDVPIMWFLSGLTCTWENFGTKAGAFGERVRRCTHAERCAVDSLHRMLLAQATLLRRGLPSSCLTRRHVARVWRGRARIGTLVSGGSGACCACRVQPPPSAAVAGVGAGFYVDATTEAWRAHYRMQTYVSSELPTVVAAAFPALSTTRHSICGHSMGGLGALTTAMRHPGRFRCATAFAPIAHPSEVRRAAPWR